MEIETDLSFRSNGKLLLTGEYLVLKGAKALALPVKLGQKLKVKANAGQKIVWHSTVLSQPWFDAVFLFPGFQVEQTNNPNIAQTLQHILLNARILNHQFPPKNIGFEVLAELEFPLNWGLGSSSTLIANISAWANCDPYLLNFSIFKGSGYDIACAGSNTPLIYQLQQQTPEVIPTSFQPYFVENLWFVWLNQKQDTRHGIASFDQAKPYTKEIERVNAITDRLVHEIDFEEFCILLTEHEQIIASVLGTEPIQHRLFPDFPGVVKSLGAWGGDFVLAASDEASEKVKQYFSDKGFTTILEYKELIINVSETNFYT